MKDYDDLKNLLISEASKGTDHTNLSLSLSLSHSRTSPNPNPNVEVDSSDDETDRDLTDLYGGVNVTGMGGKERLGLRQRKLGLHNPNPSVNPSFGMKKGHRGDDVTNPNPNPNPNPRVRVTNPSTISQILYIVSLGNLGQWHPSDQPSEKYHSLSPNLNDWDDVQALLQPGAY